MKHILHIDLNNFYASVEVLENPKLKNKVVTVCGDAKNRHGVVLAKNQKAKLLGIKTGMVIWEAKNLAPNLVVINARFNTYLEYSLKIRKIYEQYTDLIEAYGIDECWLDITNSTHLLGNPHHIAFSIKEQIKKEIGLTVSIGLSDNKIYAKLGSDIARIDEIVEITKENKDKLINHLPVENILYVGHSTKKKLNHLNIFTIGQLANSDIKILKQHLGKWGEYLHNFANGNDLSEVKPYYDEPKFKSIGNSITNYKDIISDHDIMALILILTESVVYRTIQLTNKKATGVSLWIKNTQLETVSFQCKIPPSILIDTISKTAFKLFKDNYDYQHKVRSMGISVFGFIEDNQINFIDFNKLEKQYNLDKAIFRIKTKYGNSSINRGVVVKDTRLNNLDIKSEHIIHPESYFKK